MHPGRPSSSVVTCSRQTESAPPETITSTRLDPGAPPATACRSLPPQPSPGRSRRWTYLVFCAEGFGGVRLGDRNGPLWTPRPSTGGELGARSWRSPCSCCWPQPRCSPHGLRRSRRRAASGGRPGRAGGRLHPDATLLHEERAVAEDAAGRSSSASSPSTRVVISVDPDGSTGGQDAWPRTLRRGRRAQLRRARRPPAERPRLRRPVGPAQPRPLRREGRCRCRRPGRMGRHDRRFGPGCRGRHGRLLQAPGPERQRLDQPG